MLSPRRVRSPPAVILYELRLLKSTSRPSALLRAFEGRVRKWRGQTRWCVQAHTSPRGEVVLHVICERLSHVARLDNLWVSWRKTLAKVLQLPQEALKRAAWVTVGAECLLADARLLHDAYDAAVAKQLADAAPDAVKCSHAEPAMPGPHAAALVGASLPLAAAASPASSSNLASAPSRAPLSGAQLRAAVTARHAAILPRTAPQ